MSSAERLLVLLNAANVPPKDFSDATVTFDQPVVDNDSPEQWNSHVVMKAIKFRGYIGEVTVYYNRTPLDLLGNVELRSLDQFTNADIISQINNLFGVSIDTDDLEPITIPDLALDETEAVVVTAKTTSLGWIGAITISLTRGRAELSAIIGSRILNVLNHPTQIAQNGLPYAKTLSRSFDFSSFRDAFKANSQGYPTDAGALQTVTKKLGLPDWSAGRVTDQPTSAVLDSNQAFDRVAIVQCTSPGMVSPLYLHYNNFDEA